MSVYTQLLQKDALIELRHWYLKKVFYDQFNICTLAYIGNMKTMFVSELVGNH